MNKLKNCYNTWIMILVIIFSIIPTDIRAYGKSEINVFKNTEGEFIIDNNKNNNVLKATSGEPDNTEEVIFSDSLVIYSGYSQTYGEQSKVCDGAVLGVTGKSKRLESFKIEKGNALKNIDGDIMYRAFTESYGIMDWVKNGELAGTENESKKIEAIQIKLTGELGKKYDIYYSAHVQKFGWMKWTKGLDDDDSWCGTNGKNLQIEAIQIKLVKKDGGKIPSNSALYSYISTSNMKKVNYSGHIQTYGNLKEVCDGSSLGITGKSKRLEGIKIAKDYSLKDIPGDIVYRVHAQSYGNMKWVKNGELAGTIGQEKRIEAVQIYLTSDLAKKYDVYYTVHVQSFGWMKWTKGSNSDTSWCGTSGLSKRIEAIKIVLIEKNGGKPPSNNMSYSYINDRNMGGVKYSGHQQKLGNLGQVSNGTIMGAAASGYRLEAVQISLSHSIFGSISYRTQVQDIGWQNWVSDGRVSGTTGQGKRIKSIQIKLNGEISKYYDVYYSVYIQNYGWLGWAKNGQEAGTNLNDVNMEAIKVVVISKKQAAPGANLNYFISMSPQDLRVYNAVQNVYNQTGRNLYNCFVWCVNKIRYVRLGYDVGAGCTNSQWFALFGLESEYGDCRTYAAAFYQLAKGMGYDCHYVYGYVPSYSRGLIDHAWVEINLNGSNYVFDPDFQHETGRNGYQIYYGMSGTWRYSNYGYQP